MALIVPTQATENQAMTITLGGQVCQLNIYQTDFGLFMNIYVANVLIVGGVICQNLNRIVTDSYLGFVGDFVFYDTQGVDDPEYAGLGTRFLLVYLEASDLASGVVAAGSP